MKTHMKKALALLTAAMLLMGMLAGCGAEGGAEGGADDSVIRFDEKHFPDEEFRACMEYESDTDGDGILSPEEAAQITDLDLDMEGFADMTGLEYYPDLARLFVGNTPLTSIDLGKYPSLEWARFSFLRDVESISLGSSPKLKEFAVLDCNQLTQLDAQGASGLEVLSLNHCGVTSLDLSKNTALKTVALEKTGLTGMLDLSACTSLEGFSSTGNDGLEGLILPQSRQGQIAFSLDTDLTLEYK